MSLARTPEAEIDEAPSRGQRLTGGLSRLLSQYGAAAGALGVRLGAAGLAYILQIVLARALGAADYGTFSFAWSLVTIGGFLATLGFGQIAVRFLAQYQQAGQHGLARGFLRMGLMATFFGSLTMAGLAIICSPVIEAGYGHLCSTVLGIGLIALPFFALTDFMEGVARSQGWTIRALVPPYLVRQGAIIVLVVLATLAGGGRMNAETAMFAALSATITAMLVQAALLVNDVDRIFPPADLLTDIAEWRAAAIPTLLSDLALLARQNIDLIVLGLLAPAASVGLYFAATRLASLLGLIDFAVGAAFGHRFARVHDATAAPRALAPVYAEARRLTFLPGLAAAVLLMALAPLILRLFGPEFEIAVLPTRILLLAGALKLALGPAEDMLNMAGHPESVWRANAVGALIMAILCLLLARDLGPVGAALSVMAGTCATLVMLTVAFRRHLTFWPFVSGSRQEKAG